MEELIRQYNSIEFTDPQYFLISIIVLSVLYILLRRRKKAGLGIDLFYWKPYVEHGNGKLWILYIPTIIITILLVSLLANPHIIVQSESVIIGKPVMLVVDVSGSMVEASDLHPEQTGQEAARKAFENLISLGNDINFGLMIYSTDNYIARYFTNKDELFHDTLDNQEELYRIAQTTQTSKALASAIQFMENNIDSNDKAIILVSDLYYSEKELRETSEEINRISLKGTRLYIVSTTGEVEWMSKIPQKFGVKVISIYDKYNIGQMYNDLSAMQTSKIRTDVSLSDKSLIPFVMPIIICIFIVYLGINEIWFSKIP